MKMKEITEARKVNEDVVLESEFYYDIYTVKGGNTIKLDSLNSNEYPDVINTDQRFSVNKLSNLIVRRSDGKTIMYDAVGDQWTVYKKLTNWSLENVSETATAGATASGNIASVANPTAAKAKIKRDKNGAPVAPQVKNPDGTAKNAQDIKNNLMGGKAVKR